MVFVLYSLSTPGIITSSIILCLIYNFWFVLRNPFPEKKYISLSFNKNQWKLLQNNAQELSYERVNIRVDTGFFMLLVFSGEGVRKKSLVVFYDQLTRLQLRLLRINGDS